MSEIYEEEKSVGLEFSISGRLVVVERDAADFLKRVLDLSKSIDEGKDKPPIRTEPYQYDLPYELGEAASRGAMRALEKVAESDPRKIGDEVTVRAGYLVSVLNEQLGERKDEGLIGRLATALARFYKPS